MTSIKQIINEEVLTVISELFDSAPTSSVRNMLGSKNIPITHEQAMIWNKAYNIGFRYIFDFDYPDEDYYSDKHYYGNNYDEDDYDNEDYSENNNQNNNKAETVLPSGYVHLYPAKETLDKYSKLTSYERVKIFIDALKHFPDVLNEYLKKFGEVDEIILNPITPQLSTIYTAPNTLKILKNKFGSIYDIYVERGTHQEAVFMRLKK